MFDCSTVRLFDCSTVRLFDCSTVRLFLGVFGRFLFIETSRHPSVETQTYHNATQRQENIFFSQNQAIFRHQPPQSEPATARSTHRQNKNLDFESTPTPPTKSTSQHHLSPTFRGRYAQITDKVKCRISAPPLLEKCPFFQEFGRTEPTFPIIRIGQNPG